jgi:hypothetical protein
MEKTRQGEPVTLDNPKRWKKHYRTSKMQCYLESGANPLFRENYSNIRWDVEPVRRELDEPGRN